MSEHHPESSLTPAELSHEVASYIDTLKVQIHALCTTYDIPITPSITDTITAFTDKARAREIPPKALTHLLALFTAWSAAAETNRIPEAQRDSLPITATVSEDALSTIPEERGQEVTLDLREVLDSSIAFLEAKAPPTWSQSLREQFPHGITLTPDQRATIATAIEHGFTHALLMPGADIQGITTIERIVPNPNDPTKTITERAPQDPALLKRTMDHLLTTCSTDPIPGLPVKEQYTAPYVESDSLKTPALPTRAPPRTRPHLLLYGPGNIPESLKNLTYPQADAALASLANTRNLPTLTGLTNPEAELLQLKEIETRAALDPALRQARYGDPRVHAFDAYDNDPKKSNWSWHLDSRVPGGCGHGYWDPWSRQSRLRWDGASGRASGIGARPAVVVEL